KPASGKRPAEIGAGCGNVVGSHAGRADRTGFRPSDRGEWIIAERAVGKRPAPRRNGPDPRHERGRTDCAVQLAAISRWKRSASTLPPDSTATATLPFTSSLPASIA